MPIDFDFINKIKGKKEYKRRNAKYLKGFKSRIQENPQQITSITLAKRPGDRPRRSNLSFSPFLLDHCQSPIFFLFLCHVCLGFPLLVNSLLFYLSQTHGLHGTRSFSSLSSNTPGAKSSTVHTACRLNFFRKKTNHQIPYYWLPKYPVEKSELVPALYQRYPTTLPYKKLFQELPQGQLQGPVSSLSLEPQPQ